MKLKLEISSIKTFENPGWLYLSFLILKRAWNIYFRTFHDSSFFITISFDLELFFCIFLTWNTLTRSRFFNHVAMHQRFFCRVKFKPASAPKFFESNLDLNEPSSFVSVHESSTTAFVTAIKLFLNYFVEETGQLIGSAWPWHQGFGIVAVLKSEFDKDKTEYTC